MLAFRRPQAFPAVLHFVCSWHSHAVTCGHSQAAASRWGAALWLYSSLGVLMPEN